jgi:hypothetical protein
MTNVKIFLPHNRLAKIVDSPDGVAFDKLVADSERRASLMAVSIRAYVSEQIALIVDIYDQGEEILFARCVEVSDAALHIAEIAAAAGSPDLGEAARGIRAMVDSLVNAGVWHTDALELHITSLELFSGSSAPGREEADRILERLQVMRRSIGVIE